jgi:hypothetical protein
VSQRPSDTAVDFTQVDTCLAGYFVQFQFDGGEIDFFAVRN